ncbi:MAG: tetratricopeptide repeat protein [Desulfatibacillum sp.]|nr:tetratricopeptide repeat protein [Desulfatibacillum sp.]
MSLAWQRRILAAALVLIAVCAFFPALEGGFVWDDDHYVTGNPTLTMDGGLAHIWFSPQSTPQYYPLVHTLYWLEHHLWGFDPLGYHAVNLALHILAALLLWRLLSLLSLPGAWLAALLFAIHPVQVETVVWIAERKNILSAVFYLSSALCLVKYFFPDKPPVRTTRWYTAGFVFFLCALLSKTVAVTLPAAILIILWLRRGRVTRHELAALVPFFAVGLVFGLHTAWLEVHHVGAMGPDWTLNPAQKIILAGRAPWFYASKLILPFKLVFNYPRWNLDVARFFLYLYPLALAGLVFLLWMFRKKISRGPLAAVLFFLITLFPALGFFRVYPFRYSYVADHFQYMACIGLFVLAAAMGAVLLRNQRVLSATLAILVAGTLGWLTWNQSHAYKDSRTLWEHTLIGNPQSFQAHNDLGTILATRGNLNAAMVHFQKALEIHPPFVEAMNNLGRTYGALGQYAKAKELSLKALALDPQNAIAHMNAGMACLNRKDRSCALKHLALAVAAKPDWGQANLTLARLLTSEGRPAQARPFFENALAAMPDNISAWLAYAQVLENVRAYEFAAELYKHALKLNPNHWELLCAYGEFHLKTCNPVEAGFCFDKALTMAPEEPQALLRLALAFNSLERYTTAIQVFDRALNLEPNKQEALAGKAQSLFHSGLRAEALALMEQVLDASPDSPVKYYNYGLMLLAAGKPDQARVHLQKALALKPDFASAQKALDLALRQKNPLQ